MRRCLAILMLAVLPLQFSWAAVAAYCMHTAAHEAGEQAQHLGHHEHPGHQHAAGKVAEVDGTATDGAAASPFDLDCGHCHGVCASLPPRIGNLAPAVVATQSVGSQEGRLSTHAQSPPERPQWRALA